MVGLVKSLGLLFIALVFMLPACSRDGQRPERIYTVYVNLSPAPKPKAAPEPVVKQPQPAPTSTPVPVPTADPLKVKVQKRFASLVGIMNDRGILERDIPRGVSRLRRIRELIQTGDYRTTESLLTSFVSDLNAIKIDEAFITKKNDRLLELIQSKQPSAEVQTKIDAESEAINQLLEKEDYVAINRRMNSIFRFIQN